MEHIIQSQFEFYKERGNGIYRVPCPLHGEQEASCDINLDPDSKYFGRFKCFGCGASGTLSWMWFKMGWSKSILDSAGVSKKFFSRAAITAGATAQESSQKKSKKATKKPALLPNKLPENFQLFYSDITTKSVEKLALKHLTDRGFTRESIENNMLGFVPIDGSPYEASIIVPYYDKSYKPVYFISRKLFGSIRYINLENATGHLGRQDVIFNYFGFMAAKKIIICEGAFNAMAWNQALIEKPEIQAVATNGTEVSLNQIKLLLDHPQLSEIILAFDFKTESATRKLNAQLLGKAKITHITFDTRADANDILRDDGEIRLAKLYEMRRPYIVNKLAL